MCCLSFFIFHSAAFLALCLGFGWRSGRPCRHFSFFCVSTPFVMLCVSIFHQLLSRFSLCAQSILLTHLLGFWNETLLSGSYSSFVLSSACASSLIASFWMPFASKSSLFFFIFSLCLNGETKHSALGSGEHFFVFFCCTPCAGTIRYCRCDDIDFPDVLAERM